MGPVITSLHGHKQLTALSKKKAKKKCLYRLKKKKNMHADDEAGLPRNSHCINPAGALFPTTSPAMLQISADSKSSGVSMLYTRRQTNLIHSVSAPFSIHTSRGEGSSERVKASPRRTALHSAEQAGGQCEEG